MKRSIITICVIAAVLGGAYYAFDRFGPDLKGEEKSDIRTNEAARRDLESVVNATGEVLPLLNSVVKSEISGRVIEIFVEEGEAVVKDQPLLNLDKTSLETRVREAERSFAADELRLEKSQRNFTRLEELHAKDFVGEKEYLDAKTDFELAKLNLEIAQARLEDAEEDLSKTAILAPHDGIVTRLDVVEGQVISGATSVSNGTDLLTIAQLKDLYMEANINEVDVERLAVGDLARLTFDAIPEFEIEGTIDVIALSARRDGNIRVFPIEVVFESSDTRVRPGISATLDIPIAEVEDVVSVLLSAVFNSDDGSYVFVRKPGGGWERREVGVGINNLQHVEIKSGLEAGEVVALSRPPEFRDMDGE